MGQQVRLLTGQFINISGFAIADFDALPDGPVTVLTLTTGAVEQGGCLWLETQFSQR